MSQSASLIEYISRQEKNDLKGKRIAFTYIDSGYGREPLPVLQELAKRKGFELQGFPYTSPGNDQSATWTNVRRFKPDWTIIWGAGAGQVMLPSFTTVVPRITSSSMLTLITPSLVLHSSSANQIGRAHV